MKFRVVALPAVTLIAAGIWVTSGHREVFRLEQDNRQLQRQLVTLAATAQETAAAPSAAKPIDPKAVDWKKLAALMAGNQGGSPADRNQLLNFQHSLGKMSPEELIALLDEIAALEMPKKHKDALEFALFSVLVDKDPELAFDRFATVVGAASSPIAWNFVNYLHPFARKDPARAVAWLDRQIAGGNLDSKSLAGENGSRNRFESVLLGVLISTDPAAAAARLAALPQAARLQTISNSVSWIKGEENQLALVRLARQNLPGEDQAEALARIASSALGNNDFPKVTQFLDQTGASPAERERSVQTVALSSLVNSLNNGKGFTGEYFDSLRTWATSQSPANGDKVSGLMLMNSIISDTGIAFDQAADLALRYQDSPGYQQLLTGFLSSKPIQLTPQNQERARGLAEQISDPAARSRALDLFK